MSTTKRVLTLTINTPFGSPTEAVLQKLLDTFGEVANFHQVDVEWDWRTVAVEQD